MGRAGRVAAAVAATAALVAGPWEPARPAAAASSDATELVVTLAVNAAGGDAIDVADDSFDGYVDDELVVQVAEALGFAATPGDPGVARPDGTLTTEGPRGLSLDLDTGRLQLLAQRAGYETLVLVLCTPKVRQEVGAVVSPQEGGFGPLASRCRGWYQEVSEPPIRAKVELRPDRQRYPAAVRRTVGVAAVAFALLGFTATLLRRGPLRRRRAGSWAVGLLALLVAPVGWATATMATWLSGAATDPLLLGGGTVGEQVARTTLPGFAFLAPAVLPAVLLLGAPRPDPPAPPPPAPQPPLWWPLAWWPAWAAAQGRAPG